jgi:hypothetical protein
LRLIFSGFILNLFQAVIDNNLQTAYIYAAILSITWYLSQVCGHSATLNTYILASKIKAALAMLLYAKISKLTSFVIKSS